jgi:acriflavin resistance protein B
MAITVIFGLAFSTILTLVLIPILYSVVDSFTVKAAAKLKGVFGGLKKKGAK